MFMPVMVKKDRERKREGEREREREGERERESQRKGHFCNPKKAL